MAQQERKENLLVFGATGYIGTHIINKIIKNKESFGRIAIFTSPGTVENKPRVIAGFKANGVEIVVGDSTNADDIVRALEGTLKSQSRSKTIADRVRDKHDRRNVIGEQISWIKLAKQVPSITRFFPSEYGTDIEYGPESATEKPHQAKLKVRAALREASYLDLTYVVTGPYAEAVMRASKMPSAGSFNVKEKSAVLLGDGTGRISFTTKDDVGRLTVKALLHPEVSRNRALKVNSFTATDREILEEFEKQTGGQKWKVEMTSLEKLRQLEKEAWESGNPVATLFTLRRVWAEGGTLYKKRDNHLIDGDDTETLQDAVRAAIASQLADD
ncbi:Isoflavone reductase-like protein [Lachnellula suecica]|uniref:Isoflavone reductase-like protein n=1 Tax=Lachnellula suecica TaxID=602035 RepID=A0A8T9CAH4_9HELO|nr:Isoflavone reductase-like protein [Lachnellula suecica]